MCDANSQFLASSLTLSLHGSWSPGVPACLDSFHAQSSVSTVAGIPKSPCTLRLWLSKTITSRSELRSLWVYWSYFHGVIQLFRNIRNQNRDNKKSLMSRRTIFCNLIPIKRAIFNQTIFFTSWTWYLKLNQNDDVGQTKLTKMMISKLHIKFSNLTENMLMRLPLLTVKYPPALIGLRDSNLWRRYSSSCLWWGSWVNLSSSWTFLFKVWVAVNVEWIVPVRLPRLKKTLNQSFINLPFNF